MRDLPSGTVTFLFTDVEGSTRLLHSLGAEGYAQALAQHRRLIREACAAEGGVEVDTQGDAFFFAFPTAPGAVTSAHALTEALAPGRVQVRVGLHTGTPLLTEEGYVGDDVHFAARVAASAHGGQVVCSAPTAKLVDLELTDLGEHRLKDIAEAVAIYQLGEGSFPPLKTISNTNLPRPASSFLGREAELAEVLERIEQGARLLTLTGPGGTGKTRLALEAASTLVPEYKAGVFWVGLASLTDPALVTETISHSLGAKDGLAEHVGERELLLLLDNLEQVIEAAPELASLLEACPNLALLVTSRELLRVRGEVEYPVPPLAAPEAVSLFCERSGLEPSEEIAELCARLDSLPLAVELAAARTKALSPAQVLERLSQRLDLLQGGRDADPRQQTLRATIEWSYELLSPSEQQLFARLSVFAGGCTLEAAEEVAEADLDTLQSLVEKSLLRFSAERYWMLETIREYASGELEAAGCGGSVRDRQLVFFVALSRAIGPDLQTGREGVASTRLADEYENIRAAVAHAFATARPDEAGVVLGALWPFLITRGHLAEGREWAERALRAPELSIDGRAETLVAAGELARFAGDLDLAVEFKEELVVLEGDPQRPKWAAATFADLSEIALDQGDFERARRYANESAKRGGAERAELVFAELHLREGDLAAAERCARSALEGHEDGEFNYACALEILGETARRTGDPAAARGWFGAALLRFADLRDAGGVADCLDGLARDAAARGDSVLAGRLVGASSRLRQESGRRAIRTDVALPEVPEGALLEGRSMLIDEAIGHALASID